MIPVHQTTFGGPDAEPADRGNCFSAALASILHLPIDEVPRFCEFGDDEDWQPHICRFLAKFGFAYVEVELTEYTTDALLPHLGYCLISGKSPRGHRHTVVGKGMTLVHDPHPSGDMLLPPMTKPADRKWQIGMLVAADPFRQLGFR